MGVREGWKEGREAGRDGGNEWERQGWRVGGREGEVREGGSLCFMMNTYSTGTVRKTRDNLIVVK